VGENGSRHRLVRDRSQEAQSTATTAAEHVEAVGPAKQLAPRQPRCGRQELTAEQPVQMLDREALGREDNPLGETQSLAAVVNR